MEEVLSTLPEPPNGWNAVRAFIPFIVMLTLIMGARIVPASWPVIGLPHDLHVQRSLCVAVCTS